MRQLVNEHFITINKKPKRLQKPAILHNEEEEEKECLSAPYSKHTLSWVGRGVIFLMWSEDVWEVAGVSFVDKFSALEWSQFTGYRNLDNLGPWRGQFSSSGV